MQTSSLRECEHPTCPNMFERLGSEESGNEKKWCSAQCLSAMKTFRCKYGSIESFIGHAVSCKRNKSGYASGKYVAEDFNKEYMLAVYNWQSSVCYYTGREFYLATAAQYFNKEPHQKVGPALPSFERIANHIPYVRGNVVIVHVAINLARSTFGFNEFLEYLDRNNMVKPGYIRPHLAEVTNGNGFPA